MIISYKSDMEHRDHLGLEDTVSSDQLDCSIVKKISSDTAICGRGWEGECVNIPGCVESYT